MRKRGKKRFPVISPRPQVASQLQNRPAQFLKWIPASIGNSIQIWPVEQILFFNADEKYTRAANANGEALLRKSIRELTSELDPELFLQIHRATLIDARMIARVSRSIIGQLTVTLHGSKERFEVSRSFASRFKAI